MNKQLWSKNFSLLIAATIMGAAGGIVGSFALSFLVYDETGSTLASALVIAIQLIPHTLVPLAAAPYMDRLPRKPFLVGGDLACGILYALAGLYLLKFEFSYPGYLCFSVLLSSLASFDSLAYNCIYPKLIPNGMEEKGYAVASTLYPVLTVLMMPVAALLFEKIGTGRILLIQGALSVLAALTESGIKIKEEKRTDSKGFSLRLWFSDIKEAFNYLQREKGMQAIYVYMAVTNGVAAGYSPLITAFFRTAPGFTVAMYSMFTIAEFIGRSLGGLFQYKVSFPPKKKFGFIFSVYQFYELMDMCLMWIPYPLMLLNRASAGFLGINSATMREAAVQRYIPDELRARLNAFQNISITAASAVLSLLMGTIGEFMDYRLCVTAGAAFAFIICWLTVWRQRKSLKHIFEQ